MDFAKAFDKVCHEKLLTTLHSYSVDPLDQRLLKQHKPVSGDRRSPVTTTTYHLRSSSRHSIRTSVIPLSTILTACQKELVHQFAYLRMILWFIVRSLVQRTTPSYSKIFTRWLDGKLSTAWNSIHINAMCSE